MNTSKKPKQTRMAQSSAYAIGEPQSIASLPRPFDRVNGSTRASSVYGFDGSRKRKRAEVVVGVDGESINIYGVRQLRLSVRLGAHGFRFTTPASSLPTHYHHSLGWPASPVVRNSKVLVQEVAEDIPTLHYGQMLRTLLIS